ncbi:isoprenylcysteine carboxylmethyltransferase family protein [Mycolicibacterium litorale]|uniref:Isoprenylcysteine carboxylmethyltransferase family protein n=1 Tax=Candidatus Mycolicibacterium alkanivorans TaxID=2954114 RepID=A0ABS9YUM6_9MYCO|nr:isoprenylcysteine carboxylmethyltransferase family protein [Candidatus Mycolicibacterium alkanivorans]MCI4674915.1 isoprenylcysteine carboxylmethyltransferase family protein [Candidatus Mycolicibacterium alkanivorans]
MPNTLRVALSSLASLVGFMVLLFLPAGTLNYWQGWAFLGTFAAVSLVPTIFLGRLDPATVERRMHAGPTAEKRPVQKAVVVGIIGCFFGMLVVAGFDRRFGWSTVPAAVSVLGDAMVAVGLGMAMLVVFQNRYAAANIVVEEGQPLVTTGLYGIVRHPMYSGSMVMIIGMPLALGSYWGFLVAFAALVLLVIRIVDEEKMLSAELTGYRDYMTKVRYRLVPRAW